LNETTNQITNQKPDNNKIQPHKRSLSNEKCKGR